MNRRVLSQVPPILLREDLVELIAKVKELRELLREIEWVGPMYPVVFCPACEGSDYPEKRHKDDCRLKAEIDQLEEE